MQAFQKGVQATLKAFGTKLDQGLSEKQVEKSQREHGKMFSWLKRKHL